MELLKLTSAFSVCKLKDLSQVNYDDDYLLIGKTDEELSLVCSTAYVPENVTDREDGWRGFRIQGVLDFSMIGILSKISTILAGCAIGIFVVSTFNTDYLLVKAVDFDKALGALAAEGYRFI